MKTSQLLLLLLISTGIYAQTIVAHYPLNGTADDTSGNGLNGIEYGGLLYIDDRCGNPNSACRFDGIDDYIRVADNSLLDFTVNEDFAVSLWFILPYTQDYRVEDNNEFISKWDANVVGNSGYPFALRYLNANNSTHGKLRVLRWDKTCDNLEIQESTSLVNDFQWHHMLYQRKQGQLYLYVDGVLESQASDPSVCATDNSDDLWIGRRGGTAHLCWLEGGLDEIRIYSGHLSDSQIQALFHQMDCKDTISTTVNLGDTIISYVYTPVDCLKPYLTPNPATNSTTLYSSSSSTINYFEIVDQKGAIVYSFGGLNLESVEIPTELLAQGWYIVRLIEFDLREYELSFIKM